MVAHQIGLHPLVTLMGIYVGFRMFGFAGMFIVPLILLLSLIHISLGRML